MKHSQWDHWGSEFRYGETLNKFENQTNAAVSHKYSEKGQI